MNKSKPLIGPVGNFVESFSVLLVNVYSGRIDLTGPGEEWPEGVHLCHDAAHGPDVDGGAVVCGPQEHLWGPVPARPRRS